MSIFSEKKRNFIIVEKARREIQKTYINNYLEGYNQELLIFIEEIIWVGIINYTVHLAFVRKLYCLFVIVTKNYSF